MVGKNQSSWQSTKEGTIENLTTLEGGGGILRNITEPYGLKISSVPIFLSFIILYLL